MKIRNLLGIGAVVGGVVATALTGIPAAGASEVSCQLANYCGTLHGADAAGTAVALDAKKTADLGIDIGYPDVPGDRATAWSLVKHDTRGHWTYQDKTITVDHSEGPAGLGVTFDATKESLGFTYTPAALTDTVTVAVSGLPGLKPVNLTGAAAAVAPDPTAVPPVAGVAAVPDSGSLQIPVWLRPGTYSLTVVVDDNGVSVPGTVLLTVSANVVFVPGVPLYSIVYVTAQGTWTSDCVTALGNGLLRNEPCTLGRAPDQLFKFFTFNAGVLGTGPAVVSNTATDQQYAVYSITSRGYLEDQSTVNPLVPLTDKADAVAGTGRELDVNATAAAAITGWSFNS